jgi:hypothetical protein
LATAPWFRDRSKGAELDKFAEASLAQPSAAHDVVTKAAWLRTGKPAFVNAIVGGCSDGPYWLSRER